MWWNVCKRTWNDIHRISIKKIVCKQWTEPNTFTWHSKRVPLLPPFIQIRFHSFAFRIGFLFMRILFCRLFVLACSAECVCASRLRKAFKFPMKSESKWINRKMIFIYVLCLAVSVWVSIRCLCRRTANAELLDQPAVTTLRPFQIQFFFSFEFPTARVMNETSQLLLQTKFPNAQIVTHSDVTYKIVVMNIRTNEFIGPSVGLLHWIRFRCNADERRIANKLRNYSLGQELVMSPNLRHSNARIWFANDAI